MAVRKKSVGTTLNLIAAILALVVLVSFFALPVFTRTVKGADKAETISCLDVASVGFKEDEEVAKEIVELTVDGETEKASKMSLALAIRENEDTSFAFTLTLIAGFVALAGSLLTLLFAVLSMFAKAGKLNRIFAVVTLIGTVAGLIGALLMKNGMEGLLVTYGLGFGAIASAICGVFACIFVCLASTKKYSK